jgi:hypothetical protein
MQARLEKQKAAEGVQVSSETKSPEVVPNALSPETVALGARIMKLAKVRQTLEAQKEAVTKPQGVVNRDNQAKSLKNVETINARLKKLDALSSVVEKIAKDSMKKPQKSFMSEADLAALAEEGGTVRNSSRYEAGKARLLGYIESARQASDKAPSPKTGKVLRKAVEALDRARGRQKQAERVEIVNSALKSVPEEHKEFLDRYLDPLKRYFE